MLSDFFLIVYWVTFSLCFVSYFLYPLLVFFLGRVVRVGHTNRVYRAQTSPYSRWRYSDFIGKAPDSHCCDRHFYPFFYSRPCSGVYPARFVEGTALLKGRFSGEIEPKSFAQNLWITCEKKPRYWADNSYFTGTYDRLHRFWAPKLTCLIWVTYEMCWKQIVYGNCPTKR